MKVLLSILLVTINSLALAQECPPTPALTVAAPGYEPQYGDTGGTVIDPARQAAMQSVTKQMGSAYVKLIKMASPSSLAPDSNKPQCAARWLVDWAKADVNTVVDPTCTARSKFCMQSYFELKWGLVQEAQAYLAVKDGMSDEDQALVEAWLKKAGNNVLVGGEHKSDPYYVDNNHEYWVGLSLMSVAAATGDYKFLKKAHRTYSKGVNAVRSDGFLPRELERKSMTVHYHAFAVAPLILMAEMSKMFGEDWYSESGGALKKLSAATMTIMVHPEIAEKMTGSVQTKLTDLGVDHAWIVYAKHQYGEGFVPEELRNLSAKPATRFYPYDVESLFKAGVYDRKVKQTAKAGWLD